VAAAIRPTHRPHASIVLATLNARYAHASLGLRCLRANLGALRDEAEIVELCLVCGPRSGRRILARRPRIVASRLHWNVEETARIVGLLKAVRGGRGRPRGPRSATKSRRSRSAPSRLRDHRLGRVTFADWRADPGRPAPPAKVHAARTALANSPCRTRSSPSGPAQPQRLCQASRGCPFKCEFCLSALDRTAWPFRSSLPAAAGAAARARRAAVQVRRPHLQPEGHASLAILRFFPRSPRADPADPPFAHFELIPDSYRALMEEIAPSRGALQLEIGIQTFNRRCSG